jgi:predicted nucleic acid-binding protein
VRAVADTNIVETAVVGHADAIVTQDDDPLDLVVPGIQIVSAWEMIQLLGPTP